jgi:2-oxoglutarate ferredoxin oxidoreductase subunit gamma
MQEEFVFSGFGGQGVMFVGQLLAYAAMDEGLEVTWIPSYGPEMRGGTAHCTVVISDQPIGSPIVRNPKTAVVFNLPSFEKYESLVKPNGLLAINSALIEEKCTRTDLNALEVPATSLAEEVGSVRVANIVMLGALLTALPVVPLERVKAALEGHLPAHRQNLLEINFAALERGAGYIGARG